MRSTNEIRSAANGTESAEGVYPRPAIGISLAYRLSDFDLRRWSVAHDAVLADFPWLHGAEIHHGATSLYLWSHFSPQMAMHTSNTGDLWVLVGSPFGRHSWKEIAESDKRAPDDEIQVPWEGRWALLRISPDGQTWHAWNDWAAAFPLFYTSWGESGIVSSLETVVVKVADLSPSQFSKRGLVELLLLGQYLGTDTLYESMKVVPADSHVVWRQGNFENSARLWTVQPSDANFATSRRQLIDTLHDLTWTAVSEAMDDVTAPVLLPLSSGMDSRLIAAVATDLHLPIEAYSYGRSDWAEVYYAKRLAQTLEIPWQRIDLGLNYRADFIRPWLNWFGSSLHAHGMYQFPLLKRIQGRGGIVPNGFYGNNMAGGDHPNDCLFEVNKNLLERFCGYGIYWTMESMRDLLDYDPAPYFLEMEGLLQDQVALVVDWPEYQQMNAIDMWNRQARFIFYQPTVYSYYGQERSPFMYREYARFCQSLPPNLLKKRNLQVEMLDTYWPHLGKVGGTFRPPRGKDRIWHSARYHVAKHLPRTLRPLVGVTWLNKSDSDCAFTRKWDNLFPVSPDLPDLSPLRATPILEAAQRANAGNVADLARIAAVQPVLARLLDAA